MVMSYSRRYPADCTGAANKLIEEARRLHEARRRLEAARAEELLEQELEVLEAHALELQVLRRLAEAELASGLQATEPGLVSRDGRLHLPVPAALQYLLAEQVEVLKRRLGEVAALAQVRGGEARSRLVDRGGSLRKIPVEDRLGRRQDIHAGDARAKLLLESPLRRRGLRKEVHEAGLKLLVERRGGRREAESRVQGGQVEAAKGGTRRRLAGLRKEILRAADAKLANGGPANIRVLLEEILEAPLKARRLRRPAAEQARQEVHRRLLELGNRARVEPRRLGAAHRSPSPRRGTLRR